MNPKPHGRVLIIEAVFVGIAGFMLLLFLFLPGLSGSRKGKRIVCLSNQKQVALAFALWVNDHEKLGYPFQLSVADGGTRELAWRGMLLTNYRVIHAELNTPKVLTCPSDKKRNAITNFYTQKLTQKNLSFFLNIQASISNSNQVLLGDRALTLNGKPVRGWVEARRSEAFGITNWFHHGPNLALASAVAVQANETKFRDTLRHEPSDTIRLLVP